MVGRDALIPKLRPANRFNHSFGRPARSGELLGPAWDASVGRAARASCSVELGDKQLQLAELGEELVVHRVLGVDQGPDVH